MVGDMAMAVALEWGGLLLRWLHVIAGIAWIGSSFYFIALDLSLRKYAGLPDGVSGEAWQVHGGGFYRMQKYVVAPPELPAHLTWFKWESYATLFSGWALLVWIYYLQADLYLIDPAVRQLSPGAAGAIGFGSLILGYIAYDRLCASPLGKNDTALALIGFFGLVAAAFGYQQIFGARGAFIHTGALIGTIMSLSVMAVIIPNQRIVIADLIAGRTPDPKYGKAAKQRSLHNNYLTLPVVFLMLSNHSPLSYSSPYAYLVVGLVIIAGTAIRHFFNEGHAGRARPWWSWGVAALAMAAAIVVSLAGPLRLASTQALDEKASADEEQNPLFVEAVNVIQVRCAMCHGIEPLWPGMVSPPKGVRLDNPAEIARHARQIYVQSVLTHAMPPNNITELLPDERQALAAWIASR